MADTIRYLSTLQTLFADNVNGEISPQDLRDFLVTSVPSGRTPDKVVAASDATLLQRAQADYVCDGTSDEVQIELAIQALALTGGIVQLVGFNFSISSEIDIDIANVTVRGNGASTILTVAAGTGTDQDTFQITANNSEVSDLQIVGGNGIGRNAVRVGENTDGVHVSRVTIINPNQHGIGATGSSGNLITRLSINDVYVNGAGAGSGDGQGIVLGEFTANCSVTNYWGTGCQESGLHTFNNNDGVATDATMHTFENLFCWSNTVHGISIQDINGCNGSGFFAWSNGTHGIRFNDAINCNISNGYSYLNGNDGFNCNNGCTNLNVTNVTCDSNVDNGFDNSAPSAAYTNCRAINHTGTGDRGFSNSGTATNCQFINCIADSNYDNIFVNVNATGIQFFGGALTNASNNNVTDNAGSSFFKVSGYVTANTGTATISNGNTTVAVSHGLDITPSINNISVTPIEAWGNATQFYVNDPTSSNFDINVDGDPGQDVDFVWTIVA